MQNKSEKERMEELLEGFEQRGEIFKKEKSKVVDEKAFDEAFKKLEKTAFLGEMSFTQHAGRFSSAGGGDTVNSILDTKDSAKYTKFGMGADKMPAAQTGITPKEALEISIKRAIESGDPINGIAFYDEINWNLAKMNFNPKSALDIKNALSDLLKYGEIRD